MRIKRLLECCLKRWRRVIGMASGMVCHTWAP